MNNHLILNKDYDKMNAEKDNAKEPDNERKTVNGQTKNLNTGEIYEEPLCRHIDDFRDSGGRTFTGSNWQ